jgi:hypothetical protein
MEQTQMNDCNACRQQERINRLMERNELLAKENDSLRREVADLQDSNAMLTAAASEHAATLKESWRRGKLLSDNNIEFDINQQENETK